MRERKKKLILGLCLLLPAAAGDPFTEGLAAYREGRFPAALEAFDRALAAAGAEAPAELHYDLALAAIRVGRYSKAETAAERAAARGGPEFLPRRDFLLGSIAFGRCQLAARQADTPGAPPFAWDAAISLAESAARGWARALLGRPEWPAARRNLERALHKRVALVRRKEESRRRRAERVGIKVRPKLIPKPGKEGEGEKERVEKDPTRQQGDKEMTPERIERLFELLAEKEKAKRELRRSRRGSGRGGVERDW